MKISPITHMRYVAHAVPEFDQTLEFYSGVFGLRVVQSDGEIAYLVGEGSDEAFELRLRRANEKHLDLVGMAVADADTVDRLAAEFAKADVRIDRKPGKLSSPGGGYGFRCFDIDGRLIEISAEVAPRAGRVLAEGESIPVKLSHIVLNSPNPSATRAFYEQRLGFGLRETIGDFLHFLYIGAAHHVLAFAKAPHVGFHHVAFEMRGLNEFLLGNGRLIRSGVKPVLGPGRHGAGDNTFDYIVDPSGNIAEYTYGLLQIAKPEDYPFRTSGFAPEDVDKWGVVDISAADEYLKVSRGKPDPKLWTSSPA